MVAAASTNTSSRGAMCSLLTLALGAGAAPAVHASISYRTRVETVPSGEQRSALAKCPAGATVLGGGVTNPGGFDEAWVNATRPEDGPDGDTKCDDAWIGYVDNGSADELTLTAYAICARGKIVRDVIYRSKAETILPRRQGFATARCPAGMKVVGGGVFNPGRWFEGEVNAKRPEDGPDADGARNDAWIGFVDNFGPLDPLKVTTYAICRV